MSFYGFNEDKEKVGVITISKTEDVAAEAFTGIRFDNAELAFLGVDTDNLSDYIIDVMYMRFGGTETWHDLGSKDYELIVNPGDKYIQIIIDNSTSGAFTIKIRLRLIKVA